MADAASNTYLVTGSMGCIGAWAMAQLIQAGHQVVSYDLGGSRHRVDQLLTEVEQEPIVFLAGDVTDGEQLVAAVTDHGVDRILHLAALQVPFCRDNPTLGAQVNVVGSINVFEAARANGIGHVAYASSVAVYGNGDDYPPGPLATDAPRLPHTLYGGYKVANEDNAKVYWQDHGISSIDSVLIPSMGWGVIKA